MAKKKEPSGFQSVYRLLDKIKRLQDDDGATDGERNAAAGMLNRLLLKHNISMQDIENMDTEESRVRVGRIDLKDSSDWREALVATIAEACMCRAVRYGAGNRVNLVGHDHNLVVARELIRWLEPAIEKAVDRAWLGIHEDFRENMTTPEWRERWYRAFHHGAVKGLHDAFVEARQRVEYEAGKRWGIVPEMEAEVERVLRKKFPTAATPGPKPPMEILTSYFMGYEFGRSQNVGDRQMGVGTTQIERAG
jgi:hypothetical protein